MIGKNFPEWLGEWLARIRGYTLLAGIGWTVLFAVLEVLTPESGKPHVALTLDQVAGHPHLGRHHRWAAFWAARAAKPRGTTKKNGSKLGPLEMDRDRRALCVHCRAGRSFLSLASGVGEPA